MTVLVKALRVDCGISGVVFSKLFVLIVPTRTRYKVQVPIGVHSYTEYCISYIVHVCPMQVQCDCSWLAGTSTA